uniref:Uncharacterized protein n=1 Tax=Corethron hystrix TaxID=216773 RepID=A0A7S1FT91_9STRA
MACPSSGKWTVTGFLMSRPFPFLEKLTNQTRISNSLINQKHFNSFLVHSFSVPYSSLIPLRVFPEKKCERTAHLAPSPYHTKKLVRQKDKAYNRWRNQDFRVLTKECPEKLGMRKRRKSSSVFMSSVQEFPFWLIPLAVLPAIPLYMTTIQRVAPSMPSWWSLVYPLSIPNASQWRNFSTGTTNWTGILAVISFLLSNIPYFIGAFFLSSKRFVQDLPRAKTLSMALLASGTISTIFHSSQAVLANAKTATTFLCYLDHGVAIGTVLRFLQVCGIPRLATLGVGGAGMALLACPGTDAVESMYEIMHSFWHFFSAVAAVMWANDMTVKRKQYISSLARNRGIVVTDSGSIN